MSLGPPDQHRTLLEESATATIHHAVKKSLSAFAAEPARYLGAFMLAATAVSLFVNHHLPWEWYALLGALLGFLAARATIVFAQDWKDDASYMREPTD